MKNLTLVLLVILLDACAGSQSESQSNCDDHSKDIQTDTISELSEELIEEVPRNDWEEHNLLGNVKHYGIHSYDVDENGEEIGMGGYYESYDFDDRGFVLEMQTSGCCGYGEEHVNYKRKEDGTLTHRIFKRSDDYDAINEETPLDHKEKYFYKEGVLVEMKIAGADSILKEEHHYKYDEGGQLIKETVYDGDDNLIKTVNYVYESDYMKESWEFPNEKQNYSREYYYNDHGDMSQQILNMASGNIQTTEYSYTYDDQGNWTKRTSKYQTVFPDGKKDDWMPGLVEERTIKYFED